MTLACCRTMVLIGCFAFLGVGSALSNETPPARPLSRETLKVVALQFNASGKTRDERVVAALKLLERAAEAEGPAVYLIPEYSLTPLAERGAVAANQEPVPGPMTERFAEVAKRRGLWVGVGMAETSPAPKRPYNAIAIVGPKGQVHRYHKCHLYEPGLEGTFRETQEYLPGEALEPIDIEGWRVGVMTCFDGNFPETARTLALKGAEVILYPNGRNVVLYEAEAAASANGVPVVVANLVGQFGLGEGQGTSRIILPAPGKTVKLEGQMEGWVSATLSRKEVEQSRKAAATRARRPELYGLLTEGGADWPKMLVGKAAEGTPAWKRVMVQGTACRTPWVCVGKDCGSWTPGSTYSRPACRGPQAKIKLIALQLDVSGKTKEARLAAAEALLEKATAAEGPGIYVLPELALTPLPDVAASQEPVPGPMTKRLGQIADRKLAWIVVGMAETSADSKRPYNSVVAIGPHDQVLRYRKTHLDSAAGPGAFREDKSFTAGDALETVDIEGWRVGLIAGGEEDVPEVPRVLSLKGAQILISCNTRGVVGPAVDVASASNVMITAVSNHVKNNGLEDGQGGAKVLTPPQGLWAKPVVAPEEKEGWAAKEFIYDELERWRNLPVLGRAPTIDPRSRRTDLYGVITSGAADAKKP